MQNKLKIVLILALTLIAGCALPSSKHTTTADQDLKGFRYVYITPLVYKSKIKVNDLTDKFGVKTKVISTFTDAGLRVLKDHEFKNLSKIIPDHDKALVLTCKISHYHTPLIIDASYANVIINLYDWKGKLVYHGEGKYQGRTFRSDLAGATERALQGFVKEYTGYTGLESLSAARQIEKIFPEWEVVDLNRAEFELYLNSNLDRLDPVEGIWSGLKEAGYKIGIIKDDKRSSSDYVAFVLESDTSLWRENLVKMELRQTEYEAAYNATFFMADHTARRTSAIMKGSGLMEVTLPRAKGKLREVSYKKEYPPAGKIGRSVKWFPKVEAASTGSGFVLSKSGLIVTNHHTVADKQDIEVSFPRAGKVVKAEVVLDDANTDLAVLRLTDFDYSNIYSVELPYSIVKASSPGQGAEVFTVGAPSVDIAGEQVNISTGKVASSRGISDDPKFFQISSSFKAGSRGGPLFDEEGKLIGIVVSELATVNFAVRSDYLLDLTSKLPEYKDIVGRKSRLSSGDRLERARLVEPFIVTIIAR